MRCIVDLCRVFSEQRPHALVIKRPMAPGIEGAEGSPKAHEVLEAKTAIHYLEKRGGYEEAIDMLKAAKPAKSPLTFKGSTGAGKNRDDFGKIINEILDGMDEKDAHGERPRVRQRSRRLMRPASHPQETSGGVRPRRHHGARQLLRRGRLRLRARASRASTRPSARSWRCVSARSPWRA